MSKAKKKLKELKKLRRIYLVDTENVGSTFAQDLIKIGDLDRVIVFESDKSAKIKVLFSEAEKITKWGKLETVHIKNVAANAMDFTLVTILGSLIAKNKYKEYVIISNDNGYNTVVEYWKDKGYKVYKQGSIIKKEEN